MSMLIFVAVLVVALGVLARTLYRRFVVLLKVAPVARFDRIPERIEAVVQYVLGQKKFVVGEQPLQGDKPAGWMHFFIFWGFTILGVQVHPHVRARLHPRLSLAGPDREPARRTLPAAQGHDPGRRPGRDCDGDLSLG